MRCSLVLAATGVATYRLPELLMQDGRRFIQRAEAKAVATISHVVRSDVTWL